MSIYDFHYFKRLLISLFNTPSHNYATVSLHLIQTRQIYIHNAQVCIDNIRNLGYHQ